jgi:hypothetical protein
LKNGTLGETQAERASLSKSPIFRGLSKLPLCQRVPIRAGGPSRIQLHIQLHIVCEHATKFRHFARVNNAVKTPVYRLTGDASRHRKA